MKLQVLSFDRFALFTVRKLAYRRSFFRIPSKQGSHSCQERVKNNLKEVIKIVIIWKNVLNATGLNLK